MSSPSVESAGKIFHDKKPETTSTRRTKGRGSFTQDNCLLFFVAVRLLNSLTLHTFFQPDEYYQALEPAWWFAFGDDSGAWLTWEWKHYLRSSLHPVFFAGAYRGTDFVSTFLHLQPHARSALLLAAPKVLQAGIAALGDYYTYQLSKQVYGRDARPAACTAWLTVGSAWNWFVGTRTFSNNVETTLTVIALYNWPYHWALGMYEIGFQVDASKLRSRHSDAVTPGREEVVAQVDETTRLRRAIFCAATAVMLRPTNAIIWIVLAVATFGQGIYHRGFHREIGAFIREGICCSSIVISLSALVDRVFYGCWTFPLWHFFKFNVLQSLAVFYGNNDWHYYLSQGYPLLLTAALPPAAVGLWQSLSIRYEPRIINIQSRLILHRLALISVLLPAALSVLSHKEVRFIYPILPALHVLAALPFSRMLGFSDTIGKAHIKRHQRQSLASRITVFGLVLVNFVLAVYFSYYHNSGLITTTQYLRTEFESHQLSTPDTIGSPSSRNLTFAVLMPCHSLPWRSHLQYPPKDSQLGISGWALTCEPPINLPIDEKASYQDEGDIFYANPSSWLRQNMARDPPRPTEKKHRPGVFTREDPSQQKNLWSNPNPSTAGVWYEQGFGGIKQTENFRHRKRAWPDYLIFFAQLEPTIVRHLDESAYVECARFWNSLFHDDWRRTGDVVVWCLSPQQAGKSHVQTLS